ncbi:MAG: hypothetical protein KKI08_07825 [Armatimonadetes bacterium]|nr:hypothetical protein [Armatimonadota bacterium]
MLASVAAGYPACGAEAQPQWTVLACLDARGGLSQAADGYQQRLAAACRQAGATLAVLRLEAETQRPEALTSRLLLLDNRTWREWERGAPHSVAEAIGRAVEVALHEHPARHALVVVVGHGAGLLEADLARGVDAAEMAAALTAGLAEHGRPLDVLGLDTCFGGSIEKLWDLRKCARYITAAPGLVYSPGLRWDEALRRRAGDVPAGLAAEVAALGMDAKASGAALVSVDVRGLPDVVSALRQLGECLSGEMARQGHLVTYVRSRSTSWGRRQELCDLGDLAAGLAENAADEKVRRSAHELGEALQAATVGAWFGEGTQSKHLSGVGVYFPRTVEDVPPSYERLGFAADSGWDGFLKAYWGWVSSLMSGRLIPGSTE